MAETGKWAEVLWGVRTSEWQRGQAGKKKNTLVKKTV